MTDARSKRTQESQHKETTCTHFGLRASGHRYILLLVTGRHRSTVSRYHRYRVAFSHRLCNRGWRESESVRPLSTQHSPRDTYVGRLLWCLLVVLFAPLPEESTDWQSQHFCGVCVWVSSWFLHLLDLEPLRVQRLLLHFQLLSLSLQLSWLLTDVLLLVGQLLFILPQLCFSVKWILLQSLWRWDWYWYIYW